MGFFSEVQSWFKDTGDFGGRYGQKIIIEWEKSDRANFKRFISGEMGISLPAGYCLQQEYHYQEGRWADLAVLHNEVPLLLVEIKWNDSLGKQTKERNSQLDDYVTFCLKQKECSLLVLTKGALSDVELNSLEKLKGRGKHQYFGKLSPYLENSGSGVAKLFHEYLRDKGIVMNNINTVSLYKFFHRFVNPYNGSGKVTSENQLTNGPEQFGNLLNNMRLIAQEISPIINGMKGVNRSATVDFAVVPNFSKKKAEIAIADAGSRSQEIQLPKNARVGGSFYVYAIQRISNDPWLQIEYGFDFGIKANKEHTITVGMYADIRGGGISSDCFVTKSKAKYRKLLEVGASKPLIISELKMLLTDALRLAVERKLVDSNRSKGLSALAKSFSK